MIEVSWGRMRNNQLKFALRKIAGQQVEFRTSIKIVNILKELDEEEKKVSAAWDILTKKYMTLTEDKTQWVPKDPDDEALKKALTEFSETKATIRAVPVAVQELGQIKISAQELLALEGFITGLDDLSEAPAKETPSAVEAAPSAEPQGPPSPEAVQ